MLRYGRPTLGSSRFSRPVTGSFTSLFARVVPTFLAIAILVSGPRSSFAGVSDQLSELLSAIPPSAVESGILYDRVLPIARVGQYDGSALAPPITLSEWRQAYSEMKRAAYRSADWPSLEALDDLEARSADAIPIGVIDLRYERFRGDALSSGTLVEADGRLLLGAGQPFEAHHLFAAAALHDRTYRGESVAFRLDPEAFVSNVVGRAFSFEIDCGDGQGYRAVESGAVIATGYSSTGEKIVRLRARSEDGSVYAASFRFQVEQLGTPTPDDTLHITGQIPYLGQVATADAYVYLADGHPVLTNPVIVVEGFDLDNSLDWDELYALLNVENLLEDLRADGYDAIIVNFTNAVDYVQRNAFTIVELLQEVEALVEPGTTVALTGASMGGLCSRYALAYMETHAIPHQVRTFLSFDSPQNGANIPLGIQYWLSFFASESTEAEALLAALNQPAARQMLLYHYTDPPTSTGTADPLRDQMESDLASIGQYPSVPRLVAVANGSGSRQDQGYAAGAQVIDWTYRSFLVDIDGNVWAVPDGNSLRIFQGLINIILLPDDRLDVTVSGTEPYDNAAGGSRNSMQQMADVPAPYGDIIALHNDHAFIPTISSLDLDTSDPFYDIAGDPDLLSHSPFDAIYFPVANQEHVLITPENKVWVIDEIEAGSTGIADAGTEQVRAVLSAPYPNPMRDSARIHFFLPRPGIAHLAVFGPGGRQVVALADDPMAAGRHEIDWTPTGAQALPAGVYYLRLWGDGFGQSRKVVVR